MLPEWLNKWIHVFQGFVAGLAPWSKIWEAYEAYQEDEEQTYRRKGREDPSYQEYREFLIGHVPGTIVLLVLVVILIYEVLL